ncbi:helix-turn-helix domain containing protein, partial [Pseudomonas sp. HMWF031]
MQAMAPSRLTDNQKQELLERYRQGESSAALADAFACSANTVSRTVRSLLSEEEYSALKASRSRGASASVPQPQPQPEAAVEVSVEDPVNPEGDDDASSGLALDDADDFGADEPEALAEE